MSDQQKTKELKGLTQKLSTLKEQKNRLNTEANEWAEKRNKLNEQFKSLRAEIVELKNERDRLNETVRELKQQREKTKIEIREKFEEITRLSQETKALARKKPSKSAQTLQTEIKNLDWKIQTTPLSLKEEKELVEQVKKLEAHLSIHRKLEKLNQKNLELQAEVKALETESRLCHEKLIETAQKSQEIHEKMLKRIEESKKLKTEADSLHKLFLQTRESIRPIQEKIIETANKVKQMKEEIREEEEKERRKNEEALREKLEKQAREKLRRGEKLTWEEFQILAEKGISTQD